MADLTITINPPNTNTITITDGVLPHNLSHAPSGSDPLSTWYAKVDDLAYVSGLIGAPANVVLMTGDQTISGSKNFTTRPTVNGVGIMLTGEIPGTGYLTGYVNKTETGSFAPSGGTGNFVTTLQTGALTGVFYPYSSNPAAYVQGAVVRPSNTGDFADRGSNQTISGLKNFTTRPSVSGLPIVDAGSNQRISGKNTFSNYTSFLNQVQISGIDGGNYSNNNSIAFIDPVLEATGLLIYGGGSDLGGGINAGEGNIDLAAGAFVTISGGQSVRIYGSTLTGDRFAVFPSGVSGNNLVYNTSNQTISGIKNFATRPTVNGTGILLSGEVSTPSTGYLTGYVNKTETGIFASTGALSSSSGHLQGQINTLNGQTGNYVTGSIVRPSETGGFINSTQTGQFYAASNPSGFITGVDLSSYATIVSTTGISGHLQTQISTINTSSGAFLTTGAGNNLYVSLTSNQDISGSKDFQTRPTVLDVPVLVSGDAAELMHLYGKNDQGAIIYKAQPVYIEGANGTNALLKLASNTGERTSSKTIGLLAQNLLTNEIGAVVTEGVLEGFDTSSASAGDPMWLGTSGNILYGTGNKPFGNNHQVYLGSVLRSNNTNGKVYVKVQNGYEVDELHNVYAQNASNNDALLYNSGSGAWLARQITTGDIVGATGFAFKSETGLFYPITNPSGYITGVNQSLFVLKTGDMMSGPLSVSGSTFFTGNLFSVTRTGATRFSINEQGSVILNNGLISGTNAGVLLKFNSSDQGLMIRNTGDSTNANLGVGTVSCASLTAVGRITAGSESAALLHSSWIGAGGGLALASGCFMGFTNYSATSVVPDALFGRVSGAHIRMGLNHATTATNQTLSAHAVTSGTGANITVAGGSGSAASGQVILHGRNRSLFVADATTGDLNSIVTLLNALKTTAISHGLMNPS